MRHSSLIALSHDHHHALALALRCRKQALGQTKPVGEEGWRERSQEAVAFFSASLVPHFRAEEEILFPLLRSTVPESVPLIVRLTDEHQQIRTLVNELARGERLARGLFELGDLLERHIRCEERELFPIYERQVPAEDMEKVERQIHAMLAR